MPLGPQLNKIRRLAATNTRHRVRYRSGDYLPVMMGLVYSHGLEEFARHILIDKYDVYDYRQLTPPEVDEFISIIDTYLGHAIEEKMLNNGSD